MSQRGFPHSDIPGSTPICGSPGLIAAYRVLHRLLVPRHSPYTLRSLTIRNSLLRLSRGWRFEPPRPVTLQCHTHCLCCGRKKLPFAGYSVVKDAESLQLSAATFSVTRFGLADEARLRCFAASARNLRSACQPSLTRTSHMSEGWWRIPGSNR